MIGAEDLIQLLRRFPMDVFGGFLLRVGFHVDFPQVFVQLRQRHLDRRLDRVDIGWRQSRPRDFSSRTELAAEHKLHQLGQYAVFGAENVLELAV